MIVYDQVSCDVIFGEWFIVKHRGDCSSAKDVMESGTKAIARIVWPLVSAGWLGYSSQIRNLARSGHFQCVF